MRGPGALIGKQEEEGSALRSTREIRFDGFHGLAAEGLELE